MNIDELRNKRAELERNISSSVALMVRDFSDETGFCPEWIGVDMIEVTANGDNEPQYIVGNVKVEIRV